MKTENNLVINVRNGQIGPQHDPYGTQTILVKDGPRTAELYSDGLGANRLTLTTAGAVMREETWTQRGGIKSRTRWLKAQILFRHHVGISADDALDEYECAYTPAVRQTRSVSTMASTSTLK